MNDQQLESLLSRIFKTGALRRIPKKREEARLLMALSICQLELDGIYDESEIDHHLSDWLARLSESPEQVDHVTWRRGLVDFGFLRRATDGAIYRIRSELVDSVLADIDRLVDIEKLRHTFLQKRNEHAQRHSEAGE